ncbi:MAG: hypothetical protein KAJ49_04510 [Arcobacteraceae bacterium]|nr:hypothetical protein [Arcobacteraceae bacterium]
MADTEALKSGNILEGMGISGFNFGALGTILIWVVAIILIGGVLAVVIIWFINRRSYTQEVWIFGRVAGVPMRKFVDRGKYMAFGMAGDKLMKLKKLKKFIAPPQIQSGKNLYFLYEREDNELINFSMTDIDTEQKKAGAYYVDTDMRMQRLGIEKNLRERLQKVGFFEKYGQTIAGVIFVIMVTVSLVVLFSKLKDVTVALDGMAGSVSAMANAIELFYEARVGGESPKDISGLEPAIFLLLNFRRKK